MKTQLPKTMKTILTLTLFLTFSLGYGQESFSSISFDASIINSTTPNAEVASAMDSEGNIHIAWIRTLDENETVMYTFFNTTTYVLNTYEVDENYDADAKIIGSINTLNNKPYIAYFSRRDNNAGSKNGNYAVMLASDPDGNYHFNVEQVSTNATDPNLEQDDLYSCYVNGRPNVFFAGNDIVVSYIADANGNTSWDNYMIYATKSGSNWSYVQEFNADDDLTGIYSVWDGISVNADETYSYAAFIEINNYTIRYLYKSTTSDWTEVEIGDYGATFGNEHIQLVKDNDGDVHLFWYNDTDAKFCHTQLNGGSYSTVEEIDTQKSAGGNFMPATIDKTLKTPVYHYQESFNDEHFIFVNVDGSSTEYTVPDEDLGVPYGRTSIFANNGTMYLITASQGDGKIYITSNNGEIDDTVLSAHDHLHEENSMTLYPNPVISQFTLNKTGDLSVYNVTGRKVGGRILQTHEEFNVENLNAGIYFYTLTTKNKEKFKGKFIKN